MPMNERVLEAAGFMPMEIITRATADTGTVRRILDVLGAPEEEGRRAPCG
jgi:hypothetical protein